MLERVLLYIPLYHDHSSTLFIRLLVEELSTLNDSAPELSTGVYGMIDICNLNLAFLFEKKI